MNYICIEGNIGAGKTTFAKRFAELTGRTLILEYFEENPFLASFYEEPDKHAFALEMSFLAERFQQLNDLFSKPDLFSKGYVADYSFYKTRLFAKINLNEGQFQLFDKMYQALAKQLPTPTKIVFLQTELEDVKANINARGREIESKISENYLLLVQHSYHQLYGNSKLNVEKILYSPKSWHNLDNLILAVNAKTNN